MQNLLDHIRLAQRIAGEATVAKRLQTAGLVDAPAVPPMIDVREPNQVEIVTDGSGSCWINIDGVCQLRVQRAKAVLLRRAGDDSTWKENDAA